MLQEISNDPQFALSDSPKSGLLHFYKPSTAYCKTLGKENGFYQGAKIKSTSDPLKEYGPVDKDTLRQAMVKAVV